MEIFEIKITVPKRPSDTQIRKIQQYFIEIPIEEIMVGLEFIKNRWKAKDAGVLRVGRKSIIKRETRAITAEQAQWRLKNWKMMIANYRKLGYSYPTISRIKKNLIEMSKKRSK